MLPNVAKLRRFGGASACPARYDVKRGEHCSIRTVDSFRGDYASCETLCLVSFSVARLE